MKDITNQADGLMRSLKALCEGCDTDAIMTTLGRFMAAKCVENRADYYSFAVQHPDGSVLDVTLTVQEYDEDEYDA